MTADAPLPADREPRTGAAARGPTRAGAQPAARAASTSPTGPTAPRRRMVIRVQPQPHPGPRPKRRVRHAYRSGRRPAIGLPLLLVLALLALFVSWVSAEPFWIAVGHQDPGKIEVTRCSGEGDLGRRCVGTFVASGSAYAVDLATVSGAAPGDREAGRTLPARMVSEDGRIAYAGDAAGLHLRWSIGLGLLLLIGLGIAWATGAWRFRGAARTGAVLASMAAPLVIGAVALALAW
ncbi:MAG: hypothetical protein GEU94_14050 [Micromonosporaceae bacterium]|nr:hypothetical protein [Micromonosporaceae bacterium]